MNTEQYFYRNVIFSREGNKVSIVDIDNPSNKREEMEPWFGIVFQLADGQHTIEELYNLLCQKYTAGPPPDLMRTLQSIIERMAAAKLLVLTDVKTELPYYLSMPYELMDLEKAKEELAADRANLN